MATGLLPAAEAYFQSPIRDYYPGQTVAGLTKDQRTGATGAIGAGRNIAKFGGGVGGAYGNMVAQGPQWNPYLSQVADRYMNDMTEQFSERTLPALRGSQVAGNALGSSAAGIADALAAEDFGSQVSQGLANIYAKGFDTTQGMYQDLLGQAPQQVASYGSSQMAPWKAHMAKGQMEQQQLQNQIEGEMGRWQWYRDAAPRRLQLYHSLLQGIPAETKSKSMSYAGPQSGAPKSGSSLGQQIAGGLMAFGPDIWDSISGGDGTKASGESWNDVPDPYDGWGGGSSGSSWFGGNTSSGGFSDFLGF